MTDFGKAGLAKFLKALVYTEMLFAALLLIGVGVMAIVASTFGPLSPYTSYAVDALKYVAMAAGGVGAILGLCLKFYGSPRSN